MALTAPRGRAYHGGLSSPGGIGSGLLEALRSTARYPLILNPVLYVVLSGLLLMALGARPRHLGFGPGHRTWRVTALWSIVPVAIILLRLGTGQWTLGHLLGRLGSNALQNGFSEEFLFRGALQGQLSRALGPSRGIALSALLFGLRHLRATGRTLGGDYAAAAALSILVQGTLGIGFGLVFHRSRNLVASSVVHVLVNTAG